MVKKNLLLLLLLFFCFGPATVAAESARADKIAAAINKAKARIAAQKRHQAESQMAQSSEPTEQESASTEESTEAHSVVAETTEPAQTENNIEEISDSDSDSESETAKTEKTVIVTLEEELEASSTEPTDTAEKHDHQLSDVLVLLASAPLLVAEGGLQLASAVLEPAINLVRRRQKRSPAQRRKPTFLLSPEELRTLDDLSKNWAEWENALGDLGGLRPALDEKGLLIDMVYTSEFFSNLRGGSNTKGATEFRGNLDITITIDAEKIGLGPGSVGFAYGQVGHGEGITDAHVGDMQTLSNIDADEFTQISEVWLEQTFCDDQIRIKIGKQDSGADFCALDYGGDFIGSSFGVIPTVPLPTFPDPALGVAVFLQPTDSFSFGAGVYDGAPKGGNSGFNTTFDGRGGTFSICEAAFKPVFGAEQDLPGTYRFGAWHHSDDFEEIGGDSETNMFVGNFGFYLAFDQMLCREQDGDEQGLGAFAQFGWAPENRNEIDRYFGGGLSYTGLIPQRDEDILGLGVAHAYLSNRLDDVTAETAVELFYKFQLTPAVGIQPEFQYIVEPGGNGDDALVFGIRSEIVF